MIIDAIHTHPKSMCGDRCRDYDEDCEDIDHLACYRIDPSQGYCPYLVTFSKVCDPERW